MFLPEINFFFSPLVSYPPARTLSARCAPPTHRPVRRGHLVCHAGGGAPGPQHLPGPPLAALRLAPAVHRPRSSRRRLLLLHRGLVGRHTQITRGRGRAWSGPWFRAVQPKRPRAFSTVRRRSRDVEGLRVGGGGGNDRTWRRPFRSRRRSTRCGAGAGESSMRREDGGEWPGRGLDDDGWRGGFSWWLASVQGDIHTAAIKKKMLCIRSSSDDRYNLDDLEPLYFITQLVTNSMIIALSHRNAYEQVMFLGLLLSIPFSICFLKNII